MKLKSWHLAMLMLCSCNAALAETNTLPAGLWGSYTLPPAQLLRLTAAEQPQQQGPRKQTNKSISKSNPEFEERLFTADIVHKYLGIGSLAMAASTLLAPKEEGGLHEALGQGAASLGVLAVITGFIFHWDDISLREGYNDPDNLHMALTTLGTLGFIAAVSAAPDAHGGAGGIGAVSMAVGIKMTW